MTKVEQWILARIEECTPAGAQGKAGVEELLRAVLFFDGRASQIFGMAADRSTMPEASALRAACASAIRAWFDELGKSDVASQVNLFEVTTRRGLSLDLPEPPIVAAVRNLEREREQALSEHGLPSKELPPEVQLALVALRALGTRLSFRTIGKYLRLRSPLDVSQFEWLPDDWMSVSSAYLDPAFLAIAGADGDYLGLVLDSDLVRSGHVPLVYYFHEHDPVYTWIAEGCATAVQALTALEAKQPRKTVSFGVEHPLVTEFLREMNDASEPRDVSTRALSRRWIWNGPPNGETSSAFDSAGNPFVVRHVIAQRTCRAFDEKIRVARQAR